MSVPRNIHFKKDGSSWVIDDRGKRMLHYEGVTHADTIALLKFSGIRYDKIPIQHGQPQSYPVRR